MVELTSFTRSFELESETSYVVCIDGAAADRLLAGTSAEYTLSIVVVDFASTAYKADFTLGSLKDSLDDVEPQDGHLLGWLLAAVDSNSFALHHDGSKERTYLVAPYTLPGDFPIRVQLRLPPRGYLTHQQGKQAQMTAFALGASLVDMSHKLRQHHNMQQQKIRELEQEVQALHDRNSRLEEEIRLTRQSLDLAGASPVGGARAAPRRQAHGGSRAAGAAAAWAEGGSAAASQGADVVVGQGPGLLGNMGGLETDALGRSCVQAAGDIKTELPLASAAAGQAPVKHEDTGPAVAPLPIKHEASADAAHLAAPAAATAATQGGAGAGASAATGQAAGEGGGAGQAASRDGGAEEDAAADQEAAERVLRMLSKSGGVEQGGRGAHKRPGRGMPSGLVKMARRR